MRKNKKALKNYGKYQFSFIEKLVLCVVSVVIALCVAYLFFDNLYAAVVFFFPVCIIAVTYYRKISIAKTKRKLCSQFEELMNSLSESLRAGYSLENAFFEAGKQLRVIYDKADILDEIDHICNGLNMNITIEKLVDDLAKRSDVEDIMTFSELLATARKSGGNLILIVKKNAEILHDKRQVLEDITTVITAKKLENRVMNIMPVGILLYLKLSSPEFMHVLYDNITGRMIMLVCLVIYVAAIALGIRITDFENVGKVNIYFKGAAAGSGRGKRKGTKHRLREYSSKENRMKKKRSSGKSGGISGSIYRFISRTIFRDQVRRINNRIKVLYPIKEVDVVIDAFWKDIISKALLGIAVFGLTWIVYRQSGNEDLKYLVFAAFMLMILIPYSMSGKINGMMQKRKKQLEADYPGLIDRFSLLMGAGVNMKGAWEKIVSDYTLKRSKNRIGCHYVYEEMRYSVGRMSKGISEASAYEEFGKRTMLLPYMKFSTMLVQNLKKGNRTLLEQLQLTSIDALYARRESVKRLGEEASSKLLMPMMMQFATILIVIMYPALEGLKM